MELCAASIVLGHLLGQSHPPLFEAPLLGSEHTFLLGLRVSVLGNQPVEFGGAGITLGHALGQSRPLRFQTLPLGGEGAFLLGLRFLMLGD